MSGDAGIWSWTDDIGRRGFTVTLSLGRTPDDVLGLYGADPARATMLTRDEAWQKNPAGLGGPCLRAGLLGRWAFCFEEAGAEGIRTGTLRRLSADTETIGLLVSEGAGSFVYLKDGEGVEAFQPGEPETLRGVLPNTFWDATAKIIERTVRTGPIVPAHAVLQAITKHVRGALDRAVLEGPLLTGFLPGASAPVWSQAPVTDVRAPSSPGLSTDSPTPARSWEATSPAPHTGPAPGLMARSGAWAPTGAPVTAPTGVRIVPANRPIPLR